MSIIASNISTILSGVFINTAPNEPACQCHVMSNPCENLIVSPHLLSYLHSITWTSNVEIDLLKSCVINHFGSLCDHCWIVTSELYNGVRIWLTEKDVNFVGIFYYGIG